MNRNVWILTISQALSMSGSTLMAFVGGLIGSNLATDERWSTLPVTSSIIGSAIFTIPVVMTMRKLGRKKEE